MATDAPASGWGYSVLAGCVPQHLSDYWSEAEQTLDISTREALVLDKMHHVLLSCEAQLLNARVNVFVDNRAVVQCWNIFLPLINTSILSKHVFTAVGDFGARKKRSFEN